MLRYVISTGLSDDCCDEKSCKVRWQLNDERFICVGLAKRAKECERICCGMFTISYRLLFLAVLLTFWSIKELLNIITFHSWNQNNSRFLILMEMCASLKGIKKHYIFMTATEISLIKNKINRSFFF